MKAIIINDAVQLPGIPITAQGFGRVHLQNSINMLKEKIDADKRYVFFGRIISANSMLHAGRGSCLEYNADVDICYRKISTGYSTGPSLEQGGSHEFIIDIPKSINDAPTGSSQLLNKEVTFKIMLAYSGS